MKEFFRRGFDGFLIPESTLKFPSMFCCFPRFCSVFNQRSEIEESHRELKCFQGIEKLPSGKLSHVTFRILMNVIGFNLLRLLLNSENCDTLEDFTVKTLRQRRPSNPNPKVIIYTMNSFATIYFLDLLLLVIGLKRSVQKKLGALFEELKKRWREN
jgi:hypothetical protein